MRILLYGTGPLITRTDLIDQAMEVMDRSFDTAWEFHSKFSEARSLYHIRTYGLNSAYGFSGEATVPRVTTALKLILYSSSSSMVAIVGVGVTYHFERNHRNGSATDLSPRYS